jgi:hypothetical protein
MRTDQGRSQGGDGVKSENGTLSGGAARDGVSRSIQRQQTKKSKKLVGQNVVGRSVCRADRSKSTSIDQIQGTHTVQYFGAVLICYIY